MKFEPDENTLVKFQDYRYSRKSGKRTHLVIRLPQLYLAVVGRGGEDGPGHIPADPPHVGVVAGALAGHLDLK